MDQAGKEVHRLFLQFLEEYTPSSVEIPETATSIFEQQVEQMIENFNNTFVIDFKQLMDFSTDLAIAIQRETFRFEPFIRSAARDYIQTLFPRFVHDTEGKLKEFWVSFRNLPFTHTIRDLKCDRIGSLMSFTGTVTRTSEVRPELLKGVFECQGCGEIVRNVIQRFAYTEPMVCPRPECNRRRMWKLKAEESSFVDWQKLRVQEPSEEIPPGGMPRSLSVILRNEAVESCKAGDRVVFTGMLVAIPDSAPRLGKSVRATSIPPSKAHVGGIRIAEMGVRLLSHKLVFIAQFAEPLVSSFIDTPLEKEEIFRIQNEPNLYSKLVKCIAPEIFGHEEIKRGILLMLLGGVHKVTNEGINLRGDINVCIVGDPSVAKSRFLRFVTDFMPRAIYASGQSSSAAGLTAAVTKDPESGEFAIEAGALMLADNGICCIDEFEKMDPRDMSAIHEAMEQQTISISKAGIQATLNARTSILAAANPIGGRYDRTKTLKSNVSISPPVMSRFDLFFIVLDECNIVTDTEVARHIVRGHRDIHDETPFTRDQVRRYIQFARTLNPRISKESRKMMIDYYRSIREKDAMGTNKTSYRITVRQLESLIRLSEALARLHCDEIVKPTYVREAARLLMKSIIRVESEDVILDTISDVSVTEEIDTFEVEPIDEPIRAMTISFEKYSRIAKMLAIQLRKCERLGMEGIKSSALVEWYLLQNQEEIESEERLSEEEQIVSRVVERLIKVDRVLIALDDSEDPLLLVHPNYVFEN